MTILSRPEFPGGPTPTIPGSNRRGLSSSSCSSSKLFSSDFDFDTARRTLLSALEAIPRPDLEALRSNLEEASKDGRLVRGLACGVAATTAALLTVRLLRKATECKLPLHNDRALGEVAKRANVAPLRSTECNTATTTAATCSNNDKNNKRDSAIADEDAAMVSSLLQYCSGDLTTLLRLVGMAKYAPVFEREEIDLEALQLLTESHLR